MSLASRLIENGQLKLAESYIRSALAKAPSNAALIFDAANLRRAQGDLGGCRELLARIDDDPALGARAGALLQILAQRPARAASGEGDIVPVDFARHENVLSEVENAELLAFVLANEHLFADSKVKAAGYLDPDARRSKVWSRIETLPTSLTRFVAEAVAGNAARLGVHEALASDFEIEVNAYRDGDFFGPHWDRGDGVTGIRRITSLYYFHALPAQFTGGEFQLFDTGANGCFDRSAWTSFKPINNSLLQFRSEAIHAAAPVRGPTRFADNRFCLTFWAHERR